MSNARKELTIPKAFQFDEGSQSWVCKGKGTIEYPRLPSENYVAEIKLVIEEIDREVKLAFWVRGYGT